MDVNLFVKSPIIPDRKVALVVKDGTEAGRGVIWYGWIAEMPETEFARADEAHVSEWTYNRLAEKAAETGKGIPVQ